MHKHLRAWRRYRDLTLEQVGNILKKRGTTIGRWEKGELKLTTADLTALAQVYGATVSQLTGPPEASAMIATLDEVQEIVSGLDKDALTLWLSLGRRMIAPPKE